MSSAIVDITKAAMDFMPAPTFRLGKAGDSIFGMIMSRAESQAPLVDLTADTLKDTSPPTARHRQPAAATPEQSSQVGSTVGIPSGETPMERLERNLTASGRPLEEMSLPGDEAGRLEDLMVRSGYEREAAQGIIERSRDEDGNINLGRLFGNIKDNPPSEGPILALPISAQPMLMQILQQLGVDQEKVRQFFESLPRQGDMVMISGVKDLLAEAGAAAKEVDTSVLKDLLTSLGLSDKEAEALMFKAADSQSRFSPQDLMNMLKAAAATQGEALTKNLKEMATRIQNGTPGKTGSDAAALKAQVDEILRGDKSGAAANRPSEVIAAAKNASTDSETLRQAVRSHVAERAHNGQAKNAADQQKSGEQSFKEMAQAGGTNDPALARQAAGMARGQSGAASAGTANAARVGQALNANGASGQNLAQGTAEAMGTGGASRAGGAGGARATLPTYVVRQVGTQMAQMAKQGQQVMRFSLRPAHLGQLNLRLEVADGSLKATLVAESAAAKGILESGLGQLKDQLTAQGLKIERFEVQVDPDAQRGHNQAQQHGQAGRRHGSAQGGDGSAEGADGQDLAGLSDADDDTALYDQDGRLSVFA